MSMQIETEKPNSVAFSIPLDHSAASPEKAQVIKQRLEKRLTPAESEETAAQVQERLEHATKLRDLKLKNKTRVLQELDSKREKVVK